MNARSILPSITKDLSYLEAVIRAVAGKWGIDAKDILGRSRSHPVAFARQLCMALSYKETNLSLCQVGECFGNRHYTTVIHAIKKVDLASRDKTIALLILEVLNEVRA